MFDEYCGGVSNCHLTFAPDQSWTCQNDLFALDGPPQAIEGMCFLNLGSQAWCYYGTLTIVT